MFFVPEYGQAFWYVSSSGEPSKKYYNSDVKWHRILLEIGNCYRTKEDCENSFRYKVMNDPNEYLAPWYEQKKPDVVPDGLMYWDLMDGKWEKATMFTTDIYRISRQGGD